MSLTEKQSFYLSLINEAREQQKTLRQVAHENQIKPDSLYAAAQSLKRKGYLPTTTETGNSFARLTVEATVESCIELKTQLPNGQLIWMSVPSGELRDVLKALSA